MRRRFGAGVRAREHPQGDQGRLTSLRAQLLPALSSSRTPRRSGRYIHQPSRVSVRDPKQAMGWTVVDMKNDWKTIFPFGSK
jgi:hypothetical protein